MFVLAQLCASLALLFGLIFKILYFLLVIRILLSWFHLDPFNDFVNALYRVTEPLLIPFRKLPLRFGGIDFSPVLAFLCLTFLDSFVVGSLRAIALRLGS